MIMKKFIALLLLLTLSCGENGTDESYSEDRTEPPPPEGEEITFEQLKANVLTPGRCLTCHGSGGTNAWPGSSEEEQVLSRVSDDRDHTTSPLYTRSADESMPPGGPAVNEAGLEYIRRFIEGLDSE